MRDQVIYSPPAFEKCPNPKPKEGCVVTWFHSWKGNLANAIVDLLFITVTGLGLLLLIDRVNNVITHYNGNFGPINLIIPITSL